MKIKRIKMKGIIKTYFEDKQFGFIINEQEEEYFFHKSKIKSNKYNKIQKNMLVTFNDVETKKGLTAENVHIIDNKNITQNKYILPDTIYTSRYDHIQKWKTIFKSNYIIHMTDKGNPNQLKQNMMQIASDIGANCILELTYNSEEGSEPGTGSGTHYFTVHHYSGKFAFIAKKSTKGKSINKNQINQIDNKLLKDKEEIEKKYSASSIYSILLLIGFIGLLLYFNIDTLKGEKEFSWLSLVFPLIIFGTLAGSINNHTKCWIETS
jgi:cold shock CspA family protein